MKLSLLLALVVLVSVSQQQQRSYGWSSRHLPAAYFSRNAFTRPGLLNYNYFNSQEQFDDEEGSFDDESELYPDIQARRPAFGGSSKASIGSRNKPQKKLFVPNNFLSLASAFGNGLSITTSTTTNYVIVTATATVATVQSCIGSGQFSVSAGATPVTYSQPCLRRRRLAAEIVDGLQESSVTIIEPSSVAPLETSAAPLIPSSNSRRNYQIQPTGDISSSITDEESYSQQQEQQQRQLIQPRVQSSFKVVVTVSSTFTSYAFATTTIKRSFTVGNTAPPGLVCLPPGFTVC